MTALVVPIVVALIAAAGAYLGVRRKSSGRIGTSEASDLWAESQAIRRELRDEVALVRKQALDADTECKRQIDELRRQIAEAG